MYSSHLNNPGNGSNGHGCQKQINLFNTFRKLWSEHVMWTRSFIVSAIAGLDDISQVTVRLLRNPTDYGEVFRKYYNSDNAKTLESLLRDHLLIAATLVNYAMSGNNEAYQKEREKWFKNADDMAMFLSQLNPYWSRKEWQDMLYEHLAMVEAEAVDRLNKNYTQDIENYDKMYNEALKMADYMADGIRRQFDI